MNQYQFSIFCMLFGTLIAFQNCGTNNKNSFTSSTFKLAGIDDGTEQSTALSSDEMETVDLAPILFNEELPSNSSSNNNASSSNSSSNSSSSSSQSSSSEGSSSSGSQATSSGGASSQSSTSSGSASSSSGSNSSSNSSKDKNCDHKNSKNQSSSEQTTDGDDEITEGSKEYICVLEGSGKSVRLGIDQRTLEAVGSTPQTVCMSEKACLEVVADKFDVKSAEKRGFCKQKSPHIVVLSIQQVMGLVQN